ncbi:hypothetical protein Cfor_06846 [Coptotermes formosanus]|uniref:Uncharacterized protein n=1 Tax=Coptotermes formosanus TaxID=36987 RepID=A0A6L2PNM6_COPFO|nr:hypothetical protein Cfor_06846 [Coptotermes formosanus]
MDSFTDELVRRKADKWKYQNVQKCIECKNERNANDRYQESLQDPSNSMHGDIKLMDELIIEAIRHKEYKHIIPILNYSRRNNHCPSPEVLLEAASIFSRLGDKTGIQVVKSVCKCLNRNEFYNQAEYKHYIAEAAWVSGNIGEALDMFADVYKHHATLRRKVRNMTKFLFGECISNRSEASLVLITNFAKKFANEYGDYYFLSFLWQFCFLSEWFCDQKMASELLEQYKELRIVIMDRIKVIAVTALRQEEFEVVQRLLEVTLRYEMRHNYTYILREFFDLKCAQRDLAGCSAILTSALELNVSLKPQQHEKFCALLLDFHGLNKQLLRTKQQHYHKPLKVPSFQLKF